jgi:hypothetical protein
LFVQAVCEGGPCHRTRPAPAPVRPLDKARALEDLSWLSVAAMKNGSLVFYRFAIPGEL